MWLVLLLDIGSEGTVLTCRYGRGARRHQLVLCLWHGICQVRDGCQALGVDGRQTKGWPQDVETEDHVGCEPLARKEDEMMSERYRCFGPLCFRNGMLGKVRRRRVRNYTVHAYRRTVDSTAQHKRKLCLKCDQIGEIHTVSALVETRRVQETRVHERKGPVNPSQGPGVLS